MSMISKLTARMRRFNRRVRQDEDGVVSMEFIIWAPMFFVVFLASVETGFFLVKHVMLERGMDHAMRDVRLGNAANRDDIKQTVCARALIIPDCESLLTIEMRPVNTNNWSLPLNPGVACIESDETIARPVFNPGTENEMVMVRACAIVRPIFPNTWFALKLTEAKGRRGYWLVSSSVFVNEPS